MTRETLEELRGRLLRQDSVKELIRVRAYEIFQMRGGQPGGEARDWFQAENEVLAFLIADESAREDARAEGEGAVEASHSEASSEPFPAKKPRIRAATKPASAKKAAAKKAAAKQAKPKTSAGSKTKPKRAASQSKPASQSSKEESVE